MTSSVNPYCVLGLDESASIDQVESAYRDRANKYHPDKGGDAWAFQQVKEAYERILSERAARPASEGVKSANTPDSESTNAPQSPVSVIDSIPEWAWWVFAIVMFVLGFSTFGVPTILVWTAIGVSLLAGYSYYESRYVPAHEQTIIPCFLANEPSMCCHA